MFGWMMRSHGQKFVTAAVMVICLVILLCTVYVQQQPYRYIQSSSTFRKSLLLDDAERIKTIEEIWTWYRSLTNMLGRETMIDVEANCKLKYGDDRVMLDGKEYARIDSDIYDPACANIDKIREKGEKKTVYIAGMHQCLSIFLVVPNLTKGNHEVLSFGYFTKRSFPTTSEKRSSKTKVNLLTESSRAPDVMRDPKLIELCTSKYGMCLLRDGFQNSSGSTLNWIGRLIEGVEHYESGSSTHLHSTYRYASPVLTPCYTYTNTNDSDVVLQSHLIFQNQYYSRKVPSCSTRWLTAGEDARTSCLLASTRHLTYLDSFSAAYAGADSVSNLYNITFMCDVLVDMDNDELNGVFVESEYTMRVYLPGEKMYGNFYATNSEFDWVGESVAVTNLLQASSLIDRNTRSVNTYIISRNLAETELFYSLVAVQFTLGTTGLITTSVTITYVPIVQYLYGMNGYPWRYKILYVCEILLLAVYFLVVAKVAGRCVYVVGSINSKIANSSHLPDLRIHTRDTSSSSTSSAQLRQSPPQSTVSQDRHSCPIRQDSIGLQQLPPDHGAYFSCNLSVDAADGDGSHVNSIGNDSSDDVETGRYCDNNVVVNDDDDDSDYMSCISQGDDDDMDMDGFQMQRRSSKTISPRSNRTNISSLKQIYRQHNDQYSDEIAPVSRGRETHISISMPFSNSTKLVPPREVVYTVKGLHGAFILDILAVFALSCYIYTRVRFVRHCRETHNFIVSKEGYWNAELEAIVEDFMSLRDEVQQVKFVIAVCVLLGVMQLFSHLSYSRRLGIITGTIGRSLQDLLPVVVLFFTILIAYAILGINTYGDRLPAWSNIYSSMTTLFIMILGEYDIYDDMNSVSPTETIVFFWSYVCIVFFIVFNIALAVILELYSEMRRDNTHHYETKKQLRTNKELANRKTQ